MKTHIVITSSKRGFVGNGSRKELYPDKVLNCLIMFSNEELKQYQNDFEKINTKININEIKSILDYFYSFGVIASEFYNIDKIDCNNG